MSTPSNAPEAAPTRAARALGRVWIAAAALAAWTLLAYAPSFGADVVDLDDVANLVENPYVRGLSAENLAWAWTTPHLGHWHPLTWLTFGLDHELFGGTPGAMHVVNVAWHAVAAVLVFLVACRVWRAIRPDDPDDVRTAACAFAAAIWSVHPLRVESVAWLTERRDVVSGSFYVAALLAWLVHVQDGRRRGPYLAAIACLVLSLLAKAWGITFVGVILVLDVLVLRRRAAPERASWSRILLDKLPFLALAAVGGALALWAQASAAGTLRTFEEHGFAARVAQAAYGTWFYVSRSVAPVELRPMVVLPADFDPTATRWILAAAFAIGVTLLAAWSLRRRPALAAAWFVFLVVLAPVSGLSQAGFQLVADRYAYLSTIPFVLAAAAGVAWLARRARGVAIVVAVGLVGASGVGTYAQTRMWHDAETLWTWVERVAPGDPIAGSSLARVYERRADAARTPEEARRLLESGLVHARRARVHPQHPQLVVNTAVLYEKLATVDPDRRDEHLRAALAQHDRAAEMARRAGMEDAQWYLNRAAVLFAMRRHVDALPDLERSVALRPRHVGGLRAYALALNVAGRHAEALAVLRRAEEIAPDDTAVQVRIARTLVALGRDDESRAAYARAAAQAAAGSPLAPDEADEVRRGSAGDVRPR